MKEEKYKLQKQIAKELRRKGLSYGKIRKETGIPKSTLSWWLKDFKIAKKHRERLYTKHLELITIGKYSQKVRREQEVKNIMETARKVVSGKLSDDVLRFMGVALYWAEGTKGSRFTITNSDPALVLFMVKWVEKIFNISPANLSACLNIHQNQNDKAIKSFWSDLLSIPLASFGKSYIKPDSKGYKQNELYWGTIKVSIPKSTNLKFEMFGWLEEALSDIRKHVELIRQKHFAPITQLVE